MKPNQLIWKASPRAFKGRCQGGFTLMEAILSVVILAVVASVVFKLLLPVPQFFRRFQAKQRITSDSQTALDTIQRALRQGDPSSVRFSTPAGAPPWSRIDFNLVTELTTHTSSYAFYWSGQKVFMQEFRSAGVTSA